MPLRVVPVLDLKEGRAVHAVGGRRPQYQSLRSIWQSGAEPIALARALRDGLGLDTLYLADLDAIGGGPPNLRADRQLADLGLNRWIDAGLRDARSALPWLEPDDRGLTLVAGLETVRGPRELAEIVQRVGAHRVIFSLDLDEGRARITAGQTWPTRDPLAIAHQAIEQGVTHLLILDLARVGTGRGLGTEGLMAAIHQAHPHVEISVGGGVSGIQEIRAWSEAGASNVLVGSAIHDGRIGRNELDQLGRKKGSSRVVPGSGPAAG